MDSSQYDTIAKVERLLEKHPICNQCLGRQFAFLGTNTTNKQRGISLKLVISMYADNEFKRGEKSTGEKLLKMLAENGMHKAAKMLCEKQHITFNETNECHLCSVAGESVFDRIPRIVEAVQREVESIEFDSFLVGTSPEPSLAEKNDELRAQMELLDAETLKSDFNRELGKCIEKAIQKRVEFQLPNVVAFYDMTKDEIEIQINPVFIYGRYRKLARGIPQSRWDCSPCKGKGCEECDGTGRKYPDSVSEYIGKTIQDSLNGSKFKVHAAGREDIDVLMLGNGRPFVVEISRPKIRNPNLDEIMSLVNKSADGKVEIGNLEFSTRKRFQDLKSDAAENVKEYHAIIKAQFDITEAQLEVAAEKLTGVVLEQRTPHRVSHRRADLIRGKRVLEAKLTKIDTNTIDGYFKVQGGTY
ncbi:MAG: tRNA pseudouridine(54/55) synthase Pus10, partial [Candidatus Thorarchaeota archaeon]|nr:tRNA pseudouridine(54/55) synthase Pus10 [Candidatus Thorarchaeota archaeon]